MPGGVCGRGLYLCSSTLACVYVRIRVAGVRSHIRAGVAVGRITKAVLNTGIEVNNFAETCAGTDTITYRLTQYNIEPNTLVWRVKKTKRSKSDLCLSDLSITITVADKNIYVHIR